jgi:hypothetical protein
MNYVIILYYKFSAFWRTNPLTNPIAARGLPSASAAF